MGTFQGHFLPGIFFLTYGLWMTYKSLEKYFLCRCSGQKKNAYRNALMSGNGCYRGMPIEEIVMLLMNLIGISGDLSRAYLVFKGHISETALQHMTIYAAFGMAAVVLLLKHHRCPIPEGVEYLAVSLAFSIEGLTFYHHTHSRKLIDIQLHMFIVYLAGATAIAVLLEMRFRYSVLPAICKGFLIIVQGTWFMQVGFILYSPSGATWHLDDHLQLMLVNVIYSWHFLGGSFIVLIIGTFAFARVKLLNKMQVFEKTHRQELQRKNANWKNDNEETKLIVDMHDEEEL